MAGVSCRFFVREMEVFKPPFNLCVFGSTKRGKSTLISMIINYVSHKYKALVRVISPTFRLDKTYTQVIEHEIAKPLKYKGKTIETVGQ